MEYNGKGMHSRCSALGYSVKQVTEVYDTVLLKYDQHLAIDKYRLAKIQEVHPARQPQTSENGIYRTERPSQNRGGEILVEQRHHKPSCKLECNA